ncbi:MULTISPECIES: RHS repeat-associated core domain-containing protein [unclassified Bradyrhizobium]|uniref:RHS repeat-associated core domain-containing protein n=1 Tax=unclassified Bradyrhizobium TaxID=2631580 RepID=UPI0028E570F6|nr:MULTISPECIES: RHS repeat-associated core domain-containing protein [unclassified Bradyrhizobium]
MVIQQVVEPDTPAFRLQTDYARDTFGNVLTTTVSGVDIVTRGSTSTYDARGQFATSNSNALGQSESVQYDARFGQPTSQTGPNGLTTSWSYDGFGRKILEIRPDGTRTRWTYQFCSGVGGGTAACPSGASYQVQETPYAADGTTVNGPFVVVYYDMLDREIARDSQGFDGSTIRATTSYDPLGRVTQTSRPYFVNGGTPRYTTFTYDVLGRALTKTKPDGSVSQVAYHGLSVTKTNALGQTRSVTRNSQGNIVSVTDALSQTMSFVYDAAGNLVRTTDPVGNVVTASYDVRGNKVASSDPDLGNWSYSYNTLGLLVSQTDAKGQTVTQSYDKLDRMVQSVEPDMTSVWVYDTAAHGIGKLASTGITAGPGNGYARTASYDALGRPVQVATTIDGTTYTMGASYDANGLLDTVSYPSGFTARYGHTALGDANQLLDNTTGQSYWTANTLDAELRITQDTAGNGLTTTRSFDALTGRLTGVSTGSGGGVQNFSYTYDRRGNPLSRSDANTNLNETFTYDALSRLTSSSVNLTPTPLSKTFTYDPIGNLLTKSDVGTYSYPAAGSAKPHAVMSVSGGSISTTFTYDANGNQTSGLGRSLVYTSYNKPSSITQGTRTISFLDDTDHQRFKQVTPEATTLYIAAFGVTAEVSNPGTLTQKWTDYLSVGGTSVGIRVTQASMATPSTRYLHKDHLGSVAVITNENGVVQERLSYDAWGKRRLANGADDTAGSISSQTTRGFTGEEQLSVAGLVHLNGRVYDPILARMTSADPTVPYATSSQGWNRYSYARNRPVRSVDPSGFGDYDYLGVSTIDESGLPAWNGYSTMPLYGLSSSTSSGGYYSSSSGSSWSFGYTPLPSPTVFPSVDVSPFQAQVAADNAANAARQAQVLAGMDAYNQQIKQNAEAFATGYNLQQMQKNAAQAQVIQVGYNGSPRNGKGPDPFRSLGEALQPNIGMGLKALEGVAECIMDAGCSQSFGAPGVAGGKILAGTLGMSRVVGRGVDALARSSQLFRNLAPADRIGIAKLFSAIDLRKVGYSGRLNYVVTEKGELVLGRSGHIALSGGADVRAAGEARFVNGELRAIDNASGHYQPSGLSAQAAAEEAFGKAGFDAAGKYIERKF